MAVISKDKRGILVQELDNRYALLKEVLEGRELASIGEGCKGRMYWKHPDKMCAIDSTKLHLAIGDFKTILSELSKAK